MKWLKILIAIHVIVFPIIISSCQIKTSVNTTAEPDKKTMAPLFTKADSPAAIQPEVYPLERPGPYQVGIRRSIALTDPERDNREVNLTIWYPAKVAGEAKKENQDAPADMSGTPYPLILSSSKVGFIFAQHLASYGFVVVGINKIDSSSLWGDWLVNYPQDILFALRQIGSGTIPELMGVVDPSKAGVMGYSFDGYDALAMSGARIDPEYYLDQCAKADSVQPMPPDWWIDYICKMSESWQEFENQTAPWIKDSEDGLWKPMTDERIKAVMPMAPEGAWLFGNRGLAAANRPTLIIAAEKDDINIYDLESAFIYDHLGSVEKSMITFMGKDHMMIYGTRSVAGMAHFAAAFFGYHLQGKDEYAQYFSEEFVKQRKELAWGVVKGK